MTPNHDKLDWIAPFLHFGYLPRKTDLPQVIKESLSADIRKDLAARFRNNEPGLIEYGVECLRSAFTEEIKSVPVGSHHIVPLSGGLDSRAVLIALLEHVPASQITAATFGYKGSFEVETAQRLAATLGVSHEVFDLEVLLTKVKEEELVKLAEVLVYPNKLIDAYINRIIPHHFGKNCIYWSGFMGDPLFGSHAAKIHESWVETKRRFVEKNATAKRYKISSLSIDQLTTYLHEKPLTDPALLSYYEQLDFSIRQQCYIRSVVCPEGYQYQTPFLQIGWTRFTLNLPTTSRNLETYAQVIKEMNYRSIMFNDKRKYKSQIQERIKRTWNRYVPTPFTFYLATENHVRWDKVLGNTDAGLGEIIRIALLDLQQNDYISSLCKQVLRDLSLKNPGAVNAGKTLVAIRYFSATQFKWLSDLNKNLKSSKES